MLCSDVRDQETASEREIEMMTCEGERVNLSLGALLVAFFFVLRAQLNSRCIDSDSTSLRFEATSLRATREGALREWRLLCGVLRGNSVLTSLDLRGLGLVFAADKLLLGQALLSSESSRIQ